MNIHNQFFGCESQGTVNGLGEKAGKIYVGHIGSCPRIYACFQQNVPDSGLL